MNKIIISQNPRLIHNDVYDIIQYVYGGIGIHSETLKKLN